MPKQAQDLPLPALTLDATSQVPLHRQIYFEIRGAILDGRLRPGTRLPASRALAHVLSVSRNTVMSAFDQLNAEGYIAGKVGAGSFVPAHLPQELIGTEQRSNAHGQQQTAPCHRVGPSKRAAELSANVKGIEPRIPFAPGLPEVDQFPFKDWARLLGRHWRRPARDLLISTAPGGYPPLCAAIADYLATARAVFCRPEQVIITSGSRQALDLAARVLIDPGDPVWIENPGYRPTGSVLGAAGARLVPVPVDDEGLSYKSGLALEPSPRMICISPSHQFPLGITMTLRRRLQLLEAARETETFILEDDYDSEYRYAGRPLAALQGLDQDGRVIYLGTFSKVMFPGVRLGYMVVPNHLLDSFLKIRTLMDAYPSSIGQAALADFIQEGHLAGHVRRMRPLYKERQQALIQALNEITDDLQLSAADAGMHLVAKLRVGLDDRIIANKAKKRGIQAPALSTYFQGKATNQGLLLGYAGVDQRKIQDAAKALADTIHDVAGRR